MVGGFSVHWLFLFISLSFLPTVVLTEGCVLPSAQCFCDLLPFLLSSSRWHPPKTLLFSALDTLFLPLCCRQCVRAFHEIWSSVLTSTFTFFHCYFIFPSLSCTPHLCARPSINSSIHCLGTETKVQLDCPVYGEHATIVFAPTDPFFPLISTFTWCDYP